MSATDLRHEHPANRSIPGCASVGLAAPFVRRHGSSRCHATWVEHRLTATLQLRLSSLIVSRRIARDFHPLHGRATEIPLGPGGCRDRRPLRRYPPATVFSTASRVGDVASDAPVAPDDLQQGFRRAGRHRTPDPLSPPPRQRQLLPQARAPSVDECSLHLLAQASLGTRHLITTLPSRFGFRRPFAPPAWETQGGTRPVTIR